MRSLWTSLSDIPLVLTALLCLMTFTGMGCEDSKAFKSPPGNELPKSVDLNYSWVGLSPFSYRQQYTLSLNPDGKSYHAHGEIARIPHTGPEPTTPPQQVDTDIPVDDVRTVLSALHDEAMAPSDKPGEVIEHTDDYPNLSLVFKSDKATMFRLASTSNTPTHSPWNLYTEDNKLFVSKGTRLGEAISTLYGQLQPAAPAH